MGDCSVSRTTARERPILFSGPMVRAILEGTKTQTRRIVKPQPPAWIDEFGYTAFTPKGHISGRGYWRGVPGDEGPGEKFFRSQYGIPGDRLWVRETHAIVPATAYSLSRDNGEQLAHRTSPDGDEWAVYHEGWDRCRPGRWRPSIHMHRWASRITLQVTGVRVERLQEITEDDAAAEGAPSMAAVTRVDPVFGTSTSAKVRDEGTHRYGFHVLWDRINGKRATWDSNPWAWVIEFRRVAP
jgi:hypothetical protein